MSERPVILSAAGLTKAYDGVVALHDAAFELRAGEVLGLAGHNGAGKSTLLNLLSGVVTPDAGDMQRLGEPYAPGSYADATRAGVLRIFQELSVIGNLTVAENLTLGTEGRLRRRGLIRPAHTQRVAGELLEEIGLGWMDPGAVAGDLSLAEQQLLEIAKALHVARVERVDQPVLLLDEPTSGLTRRQVAFLEEQIDGLRRFMGIVLTTHRGTELLSWSDRLLVLRDGQVVGRPDPASTSPEELATLMLGDRSEEAVSRPAAPDAGPVVALRGLEVPALEEPLDLEVAAGEVVALVSEAEEKTQVTRVLAGLRRPAGGTVEIGGRPLGASAVAALAAGVRLVPGDRAGEGLSLEHSVRWNLSLAPIAADGRHDLARRPGAEQTFAQGLIDRYDVKVADPGQPAGSLSGGNQQKLLVARAIAETTKVLVLENPTRGIDVGAKAQILQLLCDVAARGVAVIVATDEPEEFVPACHRLVVFRDGRVSETFDTVTAGGPSVSALEGALR